MLKCPVLLIFCVKHEGRYRMYFEPFSDATDLPRRDRAQIIERWIGRYAARLEDFCLRYPYQWFNFFDFWTQAKPRRRRWSRPSRMNEELMKEAVIKAVGRTVWEGLRGVRLDIDAGRIAWLGPPPEGDEACWSVALGRLRDDHWLALALKSTAMPASSLAVTCRVLDDDDGDRATLFWRLSS